MTKGKAESIRVMIAGGGTGGHLFPGIAVAEEVQRRFPQSRLLFATTGRNIDSSSLAARELPSTVIRCHGIKGKGVGKKVKAMLQLPVALLDAIRLVRRFQPDFVFGVGGYVTGPVLLAARLLGKLTCIHEQNSVPGVTNRILGHLVDRVFLSIPGSEQFFPAGRTIMSGNPVRRELIEAAPVVPEEGPPSAADQGAIQEEKSGTLFNVIGHRGPQIRERGLSAIHQVCEEADDSSTGLTGSEGDAVPCDRLPPTLLVLGGSQGAHRVNELVVGAVDKLFNGLPPDLTIIHQTGVADELMVRDAYRRMGVKAEVAAFFHDMRAVLSRADLVISRAGATSLAELTVMGKAAILIPFPFAADNHQLTNARYLEEEGAAMVFVEKELTDITLGKEIAVLLKDADLRKRMARRALRLARPEAAARIVDGCMELLAEKRPGKKRVTKTVCLFS